MAGSSPLDRERIAALALASAGIAPSEVDERTVAMTLDAVRNVPPRFAAARQRSLALLNDVAAGPALRARAWLALAAIDGARGIGRIPGQARSLADLISARIDAATEDRSIANAYGGAVEACVLSGRLS